MASFIMRSLKWASFLCSFICSLTPPLFLLQLHGAMGMGNEQADISLLFFGLVYSSVVLGANPFVVQLSFCYAPLFFL